MSTHNIRHGIESVKRAQLQITPQQMALLRSTSSAVGGTLSEYNDSQSGERPRKSLLEAALGGAAIGAAAGGLGTGAFGGYLGYRAGKDYRMPRAVMVNNTIGAGVRTGLWGAAHGALLGAGAGVLARLLGRG